MIYPPALQILLCGPLIWQQHCILATDCRRIVCCVFTYQKNWFRDRLRDTVSDTHHLDLSIFANTVKLDLLIGQCIVQGLLGGSLYVGCFFCHACLWLGEQAAWLLFCSCVQWKQVRNTVRKRIPACIKKKKKNQKRGHRHTNWHTPRHGDARGLNSLLLKKKIWLTPRPSAGW